MKIEKLLILALVMTALLAALTGCEYDVAEPQWSQEHENPAVPQITQIDPAGVAGAGVNHIKIIGENFSPVMGENKVYFDNIGVEILDASANSITVRRPDLISDTATVKVVSYDALLVAKHGPYKIIPVFSRLGSFLENIDISGLAVDKDENVYVVYRQEMTITKVTPNGEKHELGETSRIVYDMRIAPDGNLILLMSNQTVMKFNINTGEETEYADAGGKRVSYADFDSYGHLITAGRRTGIVVISADGASSEVVSEFSRDEFFCVRVYNNYVYTIINIARTDEEHPEWGVWRLPILDEAGSLGTPELVMALSEEEVNAGVELHYLTFDAQGTMYVGTNDVNPIIMVKPDNTEDILYKDILPSAAQKLVWGDGNLLYMILANDSEVSLVKIDMGAPGAPYFGRK